MERLFDTYLDHMLAKFEPTRIAHDVKILRFLTKSRVLKTIFDKRFGAILEDGSVTETSVEWKTINFQTIIQENGSSTCVSRLNLRPNMGDPTSMKHAVSSLNEHTNPLKACVVTCNKCR